MKRPVRVPAAVLAALLVSGCAGVSITQLWRDPGYRSRPVQRVLVVAVAPARTNPAPFENAIAQALAARGFQAATASSLFPGGRLERMKVQEYVEGNGVDLLVMEHLTTEGSAPVAVTTTVAQSGGWYGAYGGAAATTTRVSQGTNVTARIDVFDVRTDPDTLIWRGDSTEVDMQEAPQSLAKALVDGLVKAQILVK